MGDLLGDTDDILGDILVAGALQRMHGSVRREEVADLFCDPPNPASSILTIVAMAVVQVVPGRLDLNSS